MPHSKPPLRIRLLGVAHGDGVAVGALQEQAELYLDVLLLHCEEKRAGKPMVDVFVDCMYTAQKALAEAA
jgi:hypothetical protein